MATDHPGGNSPDITATASTIAVRPIMYRMALGADRLSGHGARRGRRGRGEWLAMIGCMVPLAGLVVWSHLSAERTAEVYELTRSAASDSDVNEGSAANEGPVVVTDRDDARGRQATAYCCDGFIGGLAPPP